MEAKRIVVACEVCGETPIMVGGRWQHTGGTVGEPHQVQPVQVGTEVVQVESAEG